MRKNYVASSEDEEERLKKVKDVLKDVDDTDSDIPDGEGEIEEETETPKKTSKVKTAETSETSVQPNVPTVTSSDNKGTASTLLLHIIGRALATARKVPEWYKDEFVEQYVEIGSASMETLGLNIGDSLKFTQDLPTWQKYLLFGIGSAAAAFFVIPIPSSPTDQSQPSNVQRPSYSAPKQAPVQHPTRYQQRYIITPDTAVIQGMDGVVQTKIPQSAIIPNVPNVPQPQNQNVPSQMSESAVIPKTLKTPEDKEKAQLNSWGNGVNSKTLKIPEG
ncbi:MAG: hypothetical protein M1542_08445 [Thermotogae bacterium]|jgi:hypothetical protein|nr:hypothetical protein [Thermotogota bacterium]